MKISLNYYPYIKTDFKGKNNLHVNNVLVNDVFERSDISFGKSNKNMPKRTLVENLGFSNEQADIIISCGFNNGQYYQKIKILLEQGHEFDSAIKILKNISNDIKITKDESAEETIKKYYLKTLKDIERYEALSQDSELDIIDKISIIAYGLNDDEIERFKALKSFPLESYEMLLAVKFGLDDNELNLYFRNRNHFNLSPDELMICTKENFNDVQIHEFEQIKSENRNFKDETVRKTGGQQSYPASYVVACIKNGKTVEDIKKANRISELTKFGISALMMEECLNMGDLEYLKFKENLLKTRDFFLALLLAKVPDDKQDDYLSYIQNGDITYLAACKANMDCGKIEKLNLYLSQGKDIAMAVALAELDENQFKEFKKFFSICKNEYFAIALLSFSKEQQDEYFSLLAEGVANNKAFLRVLLKNDSVYHDDISKKIFSTDMVQNILPQVLSQISQKQFCDLVALKLLEVSSSNFEKSLQTFLLSDIYDKIAQYKFDVQEINLYQDLKQTLSQEISFQIVDACKDLNMLEEFKAWLESNRIVLQDDDEETKRKQINDFLVRLDNDFLLPNFKNASQDCLNSAKSFYVEIYKYRVQAKEVSSNNEASNKTNEPYFCDVIFAKLREKNCNELVSLGLSYGLSKLIFDKYMKSVVDDSDAEFNKKYFFEHCSKNRKVAFLVKQGINILYAIEIAKLPDDKFYKFLDENNLNFNQQLISDKHCNLDTLYSESLENISNDFWYKTLAGCEEETFNIIHQTIKGINQNSLELTEVGYWDSGVKLCQGVVGGKLILVVKKNEDPLYVAYNGAIAPVKQPRQCDSVQFSAWGNIESRKQAQVLAKAASSFPFELFDEQGVCIIGKNAPEFDVKQTNDKDIQGHYCDIFFDLKKEGNLNVQEILKLMPKDCMLSISPYIQDGGMLYSIVCEWFSVDNTRWQIEVHSQDMNWHGDNEWIFRFGKEEKNGKKKYFRIAKDNSSYDFNGEFSGDDAHIRIDSPLQKDDLLNSVQFQKKIRKKSVDLYTDFEIGKIIDKLGISGRNQTEKKYNLVDYCLKNPLVFAKYKDEILKLRANLGMVELI